MKLNLEVELDWIDDEMNLDETVKQNVINGVVNRIQKKVEEQVEKKIAQILDEAVVAKIETLTEKIFNDFLTKPVTVTDNYGSTLKQYESVEAIIKERFDNFLTESVNEKGDKHTGYGTRFTRINFIITKQLQDFADKFTTDAVKQVSSEIKLHVQNGLTNKLGAELMKVLKVEQMLQIDK